MIQQRPDFGHPGGVERPQDDFHRLLMLRRNLAEAASATNHSLQFPLYGFAALLRAEMKPGCATVETVREPPLRKFIPSISNADFASVWYLHKKGNSSDEIKSLFPLGDAAGLMSTLADAIGRMPYGSAAIAHQHQAICVCGNTWASPCYRCKRHTNAGKSAAIVDRAEKPGGFSG